MMDLNLIRAVLTALCFLAFLLIVYWAYGPRSKHRFDDAANLPFADQAMNQRSALPEGAKKHPSKSE